MIAVVSKKNNIILAKFDTYKEAEREALKYEHKGIKVKIVKGK